MRKILVRDIGIKHRPEKIDLDVSRGAREMSEVELVEFHRVARRKKQFFCAQTQLKFGIKSINNRSNNNLYLKRKGGIKSKRNL